MWHGGAGSYLGCGVLPSEIGAVLGGAFGMSGALREKISVRTPAHDFRRRPSKL
jgi:hypothetical protein